MTRIPLHKLRHLRRPPSPGCFHRPQGAGGQAQNLSGPLCRPPVEKESPKSWLNNDSIPHKSQAIYFDLREASWDCLAPRLATKFGGVEEWRGDGDFGPFRFHFPLVKPDMRISRIRLSSTRFLSCFRPRKAARRCFQSVQTERLVEILVGEPPRA